MRFGVHLEARGPSVSPERIGLLTARADPLGCDPVRVLDHVVVPTESALPYPGRQSSCTAATAAILGRHAAARCAEVGFNCFPHDSTDGLLESMERFASDVRPLERA